MRSPPCASTAASWKSAGSTCEHAGVPENAGFEQVNWLFESVLTLIEAELGWVETCWAGWRPKQTTRRMAPDGRNEI
jgi:hypothetical protein